MSRLPDYRLETHFAEWEFSAREHMTASDAQSMTWRELLDLATPEQWAQFDEMVLGYSETFGAPDLRATIATTFARQCPANISCFAGASKGFFAANHVLLDADSHSVVDTTTMSGARPLRNRWLRKPACCICRGPFMPLTWVQRLPITFASASCGWALMKALQRLMLTF